MPVMDIGSIASGSTLLLRDGTSDFTATETNATKCDLLTILPNPPNGMYLCVVVPPDASGTGGTSPTMTIKIQDSADGSSWADLNPSISYNVNGGSALAANVSLVKFIPIPNSVRRYISTVNTIGGSASPNWRKVRIFVTPFFEGNW